jgi:hypothetical protein
VWTTILSVILKGLLINGEASVHRQAVSMRSKRLFILSRQATIISKQCALRYDASTDYPHTRHARTVTQ